MNNIYDQVPYPSLSYTKSHPDRLATVATLLGAAPKPITCCRVLELGCASGGNLIPMAYGLPESEFVGVDYSATQIDEGRQVVRALGLSNIRFQCADILELESGLGSFDYIIAHGVFSWVPRPVQDKVFELCAQNLTSNGVAYVSYNTYPGWRLIGVIRDMMLYHTRHIANPQEKVAQARGLLDFLAEAIPAESGAYGSFINMYAQFLQGELKGAGVRGDAFLLHDELEDVNEPIYFHRFVERAAGYGLKYLGEARFQEMTESRFPQEVSETLGRMSQDIVEFEQYMDFLKNRMFRQTLLCHQGVTTSRTLNPALLTKFYAASHAQSMPDDVDLGSSEVLKFQASDGAVLAIDHPVTKAAFGYLGEVWPRSVSFGVLLDTARDRLRSNGRPVRDLELDAQVLAANLFRAYSYSEQLVELRVYAPPIVLQAGERPEASPVARFYAQVRNSVTNLRHERVTLDALDRYLLPHLDGRHTVSQLVDLLVDGPVAEGVLQIKQEGAAGDAGDARAVLAEAVVKRLDWLAHAALLIA